MTGTMTEKRRALLAIEMLNRWELFIIALHHGCENGRWLLDVSGVDNPVGLGEVEGADVAILQGVKKLLGQDRLREADDAKRDISRIEQALEEAG